MLGTLAILQARTQSTRLPGKVLEPICGEPMLVRCVERIQRAFKIDHLVVATSNDPADDPILALCERHNVDCFRGSQDDVLDRYFSHRPPIRAKANRQADGGLPVDRPSPD